MSSVSLCCQMNLTITQTQIQKSREDCQIIIVTTGILEAGLSTLISCLIIFKWFFAIKLFVFIVINFLFLSYTISKDYDIKLYIWTLFYSCLCQDVSSDVHHQETTGDQSCFPSPCLQGSSAGWVKPQHNLTLGINNVAQEPLTIVHRYLFLAN